MTSRRSENPFPIGVVTQVDEGRLVLYQEAATKAGGFEVIILATEGEEYPTYRTEGLINLSLRSVSREEMNYGVDMIRARRGSFGIVINALQREAGGHGRFWDAVKAATGSGK